MRDVGTPWWAKALSSLLPDAYRAEILDDLLEERRARSASALWLAAQILRSARDSRHRETGMEQGARFQGLRNFPRDLRHAARSLLRAPVFTGVAVFMIALGIGATTSMYAVLDAVVLRPLPYADPDRLVAVMHPTAAPGSGERQWGLSVAGYFEFRREAKSLADIGVYRTSAYAVAADGGFAAEEARVGQVTHTLFTTLGARPHLGRLFTAEDDQPNAGQSVILSHGFWQRRFGGDAAIVERTIQTSVGSRLVIGVAAPGLTLPKPGPFSSTADLAGFGVDIWEPLRLNPNAPPQNNHAYTGVARLKPGVSAEEADAELRTIVARFPVLFPTAYSERFIKTYNVRVSVRPLHEDVLGPTVARSMWVFFVAVGFVLVIACANVANLFIVRAEARMRESGIRAALGAGGWHLASHALAEGLLLTMVAGAAGIGLAYWTVPALIAVAPANIPLLASASLGWRSVLFAALAALGAGAVFGIIPLLRGRAGWEALRASGRGLTSSRRQKLVRSGLVVGQVALAVVLLASAGLLMRSVAALKRVHPGLEPAGVLTFEVSLPYQRYQTIEAALAFHRELHDRIAALPGVRTVGATQALPLQDFGTGCIVVFREARPFGKDERTPCVPATRATPG
ncbi:MAG TPA: ABC transporter permease, partial [Vicinamibacterales bacterium]|nr:ABC transporter permease [Vicinamibacterales bacterium]